MAPRGGHTPAPGRTGPGPLLSRASTYQLQEGSFRLGRRQDDGGGAPGPEGPGSAKPSLAKGPAGSFDVVFGIICLVAVGIVAVLVFYLFFQRRKRQKRQREAARHAAAETSQPQGKPELADKPVVEHRELSLGDGRRQGVLG